MSWRWDKGQTNFQGSNNIDSPGKCDKNWASVLSLVNMQECENQIFNSSSSVGATTLGGFWSALRFRSTIFYPYTSLSSFSLSPSLNPLLLGPAISILVFLLLLMNIVPIQLIFWQSLLYPFSLRVLPNVICDFINLTIFFFLIRSSNSSFVFILHAPSLSCVGP